MLKGLHTLSVFFKLVFYGLMAYFLILIAGILSGSYRFADNDAPLSFMILSSSMAAVSLLLTDLQRFLVKRKTRKESVTHEARSHDE